MGKQTRKMGFREKLSWKIAYGLKDFYFYLRRERKTWNISMESLSHMQLNSLGHDLYLFLNKNKLKIMPKAEFHDVYHVLFEYGTNIREEAMIQFVPLGNGKRSIPYLACTFVSAVFFPEFWISYYKAFKKGYKANKFYDWDFEPLLPLPTKEVREMIFGKK